MSQINFPVVGIGASAGGLKALQNFFDHMPADSGVAFVIIMHLAPEKTSSMAELISSHTSMEIEQVAGTTDVKPNHIYVIPPNKRLNLEKGQLKLSELDNHPHALIDLFFRSLAEECEKQAIGIVLSGTGSDGTLGLRSIKEEGGIMMVQDPREADYDSMPNSAIKTSMVDFILPTEQLAQKVMDHKKILGKVLVPLEEGQLKKNEAKALDEIFKVLVSETDHDFSQYKRSSILRRLERRLYVTGCNSIFEYRKYLDENPEELDALFDDLLINVTSFFRDPEAYDTLKKKVIPKIFENKKKGNSVRVWSVGCATGEEAYSLAILLHEYAANLGDIPKIKIFGTDISDAALSIARKGVYPESIVADVPGDLLRRYFHKEDSEYRVKKQIRDSVIISKHNLLADPPFVNQDLIACRNLLIYFNKELQAEALKILHHSLKSDGFLFLGSSDSTISASNYFESFNKSKKIFSSRYVSESKKEVPLPLLQNMHKLDVEWPRKLAKRKNLNFEAIHNALLANRYAPASVIIDEDNQVVHSSKGIEKYLQYTGGEPSQNLLEMTSSQLLRPLRTIIFQYDKMKDPQPISKEIQVDLDGEHLNLRLQILPLEMSALPGGYRQLIFEKLEDQEKSGSSKVIGHQEMSESEVEQELLQELEQRKEQLQQVIEEYEASHEELMASNEELQSMNEELQTTSEELETSKEELQSVNEELKIVNEELERKVDQLQQANDDLKNLMETIEVGIIFVDRELRIKRFTNNVNEFFNLLESDLDRPLSHVTHDIKDVNLVKDVKGMLEDLEPIKKVVTTTNERSYMMRIKPYKTTEYKIEGAVLSFVDITDLKRAEALVRKRAKNEESLVNLGIEYLEYQDPQKVGDKALEMLKQRFDMPYLSLFKLNEDESKLVLTSGEGWNEDEVGSVVVPLNENSVFDYVLNTETPITVIDFKSDNRFEQPELLSGHNIKSGIIAEVRGSQKRFGVLAIYDRHKVSFEEYEINFIQNTAHRIGEALERIHNEIKLQQINEKLQEKIEIQKKLQQDVLRVEKKERWSIGQFLHDELSQNLLAAKTLVDSRSSKNNKSKQEKGLDDIQKLIVDSLGKIRELSHFILPLNEEVGKGSEALGLLARQTENVYDIDCIVTVDDKADNLTDKTVSSSLYYIAQEAVNNAIKHGEADTVEIDLSVNNEKLNMTIKDNGMGFTEEPGNGEGINIMKYRAELLNGTVEVRPVSEGSGTVVICSIPLAQLNELNNNSQ